MARVSQEHLDARRRQILVGARRCFTRNGFHATSMQDVLAEVGLSAGAVYRYFRGKDEIVAVIVGEVLESVRQSYVAVADADPPPPPDTVVASVFQRMRETIGEVWDESPGLPQLLIQVWSESLRNQKFADTLNEGYQRMCEEWVLLVRRYQAHGWVCPEADAENVARVFVAMMQGYFVQVALISRWDPDDFVAGLSSLVSMSLPRPRA
ncbi:TetR/AcrR family transcriptional regulator [Streptomyces sulphureus]|uniref:TetR/AcrR family transcriptional regulator n=1 Tax=Streptomyces sulphureus TaxID=47758 RepID=UPI000369E8DD|nr:TetR/AcrR family transcriptional regulator [Streptomyces sulphureus]